MSRTLRYLPALLLLAAAPLAFAQAPEPSTESERLYAWFQEVFEDELSYSPQAQTALGMISDLDAYGRWDDPTDEAALRGFERGQRRLAEMRVRESAFVFSPILDSVISG
jgi:hypothetical protein